MMPAPRGLRRLALAWVFVLPLGGCGDDAGPGQALAPFTVEDAAGAPVAIPGDRAGSTMVLMFWVSWCAPCRQELAEVQAVADQQGNDLAVFAVNVGDPPETAARSLAAAGVRFPLLRDPDGAIAKELGIRGFPHTMIVDGSGRIRRRFAEPVAPARLREVLRRLPAE